MMLLKILMIVVHININSATGSSKEHTEDSPRSMAQPSGSRHGWVRGSWPRVPPEWQLGGKSFFRATARFTVLSASDRVVLKI